MLFRSNSLYGVNKINPNIANIRGCLNFNDKLLHPRLVHVDLFHDAVPVNLQDGYKQIPAGAIYNTKDHLNETIKKNNNLTNLSKLKISDFQVINKDGSINPLQKWVIEAFYESKKFDFL